MTFLSFDSVKIYYKDVFFYTCSFLTETRWINYSSVIYVLIQFNQEFDREISSLTLERGSENLNIFASF